MKSRLIFLLSLCLIPQLASAHLLHSANGFSYGFMHPFSGWDHLLVMIAIGLLAVQLNIYWQLPLTFILSMSLGGFLGIYQIPFSLLEPCLLGSVILFGFLLLIPKQLPLGIAFSLTALTGLLHGYAHGLEMPQTHAGLYYGLGFLLATSLLHTTGLFSARFFQKLAFPQFIRWTGIAIFLTGLFLAFNDYGK